MIFSALILFGGHKFGTINDVGNSGGVTDFNAGTVITVYSTEEKVLPFVPEETVMISAVIREYDYRPRSRHQPSSGAADALHERR